MRSFKRLLAVLLMVVTVICVTPINSIAAEDGTHDYFVSKYPALTDADHVLNTAEYYQFYEYMLGGTDFESYYFKDGASVGVEPSVVQPAEGKYVFAIGGASNAAFAAAVPAINDVAKEFGITAVYNFDPALAGDGIDITKEAVFKNWLDAILEKLGIDELAVPSIIVYEKTGVSEGAVKVNYTWTETETANTDAFKAALKDALSAEAKDGKIENIEVSDSDYFRTVSNARYVNNGIPVHGLAENLSTLKPISETEENIYEVVTLDELRDILASEGNYSVLLGGLWCPNTYGVIDLIQEYARKAGVTKIYFYDTVLDSNGSVSGSVIGSSVSQNNAYYDIFSDLQTRNNYPNTFIKAEPVDGATGTYSAPVEAPNIAQYYTGLINDYLPNMYSLNQGAKENAEFNNIKGGAVISDGTTTATRVQLPNFFTYNKDNKDADGNPAPVLGNVEIMTELAFMDETSALYNAPTSTEGGASGINLTDADKAKTGFVDAFVNGYEASFANSTFTYHSAGLVEVFTFEYVPVNAHGGSTGGIVDQSNSTIAIIILSVFVLAMVVLSGVFYFIKSKAVKPSQEKGE